MNRIFAAILAALLLFAAGCGSRPAHGSDQVVQRSQAMALPPESSADEPASSSEPASSAVPTSSSESAPTPTPAPTAKPVATPLPTPKPTVTPAPTSTGEPVYTLSSDTVKAGDMLVLTCENPPPLEELALKASVSGAFHFFESGDKAMALMGVSRNTAPGDYQATVTDAAGKTITLPFTVVDAGFDSEAFQMDESVTSSTVNNSAAREEYNRITASVMAVTTADPQYPDPDSFIMPLTQPTFRVSSSYGFTRIVNGKVSGRHEGIDFPAPKGTPVVAAGDGRVLYAGLMKMTGNTVIIEHGMGLKSWYHHMDSLSCKTGDQLKAGDPVGKVGTTGYSTGNHLHFGMSINDTYTNPWQFIPQP